MTPTTAARSAAPTATAPSSSSSAHTSGALLVAFSLSAAHTVHGQLTGTGDPGFSLTTPVTYAFYALGFGAAALARSRSRTAQAVLVAYLALLLAVSVFYYPTTFTPERQTVFGWFENDVYVGLLILAAYLAVQRWREVQLGPDRGRGRCATWHLLRRRSTTCGGPV